MVERKAEGGGGGDLANGPLDGRTNRVRNPDDDKHHPWCIPLDRPCLLCYLEQKLFKPDMTLPPGGGGGDTHGGHLVKPSMHVAKPSKM